MSDGRPKPGIPAWQRTAQTKPPPATEDPVSAQPENAQPESAPGDNPVDGGKEVEVKTEDAAPADEEPESVPANDTSPTTAPPAEAVEEEKPPAFASGDLEAFKQQQPRPQAQQPAMQQQAPPIITYPEFLVEAHKPPPLITPGRILNTVYAAGTAAALVYGASRFIVNPMVKSLSLARHEYFNHTQSKVDEFNERLSKIVSKVPEAHKGPTSGDTDINDAESVTSDPTELYHRDMGTQTEALPIRPTPAADAEKKDAVTYQTGALEIMKEHINEIAAGAERNAAANQERQERMNKLRHYLDGLIYGSHAVNAWQTNADAVTQKKKDGKDEDHIEELKKEIRAVKGVLLSAKRFPSVTRPIPGAA